MARAIDDLIPQIKTLCDRWGLNATQRDQLLKNIGTDYNVGFNVLGIHYYLMVIYRDKFLAYQWINKPNKRLEGRTAIDVMLDSKEGIGLVHKLVSVVLNS